MTRVIGALKSNGVAAADIQTAQLSLSPNENDAGTKVINYTVTNNVTVNIRDLTKAGAIIARHMIREFGRRAEGMGSLLDALGKALQ